MHDPLCIQNRNIQKMGNKWHRLRFLFTLCGTLIILHKRIEISSKNVSKRHSRGFLLCMSRVQSTAELVMFEVRTENMFIEHSFPVWLKAKKNIYMTRKFCNLYEKSVCVYSHTSQLNYAYASRFCHPTT